jgi:hypothetical protein
MNEITRNAGGPAFPTQTGSSGMTLRDWFAGQVLRGFISDPDVRLNDESIPQIAKTCYEMADAMLEARE